MQFQLLILLLQDIVLLISRFLKLVMFWQVGIISGCIIICYGKFLFFLQVENDIFCLLCSRCIVNVMVMFLVGKISVKFILWGMVRLLLFCSMFYSILLFLFFGYNVILWVMVIQGGWFVGIVGQDCVGDQWVCLGCLQLCQFVCVWLVFECLFGF